ncbi:hypothetical protein V8E54_005325 [Elaphomyces granulatus]|jgi:hypothetical protein
MPVVPVLPLSTAFLGHTAKTVLGLSTDIWLLTVVAQNGEKEKGIRDYLQRCSRTSGSVNVNQAAFQRCSIYSAVETNNEKLVQLFTQYEGDVNCITSYEDCH